VIYGSVCSGIEAATAAWHPIGWRAAFYSEIEPFPCAVLNHYYPTVPNHGDMNRFKEWPDATLDILVGGTPCQSFSVAGLRKGLDDPRGNLTLVYLAVADKYRPEWLVWENVPGVLSDGTGAFGAFLGGLGQLGYGFAYRVLDAQYFRVPQRRRRVFVVGCLGDWRRAAAVLFERESLQGNPPPSRQPREEVAPTISARTKGGGGLGTDFDCDGGLVGALCADSHPGAYSGQDAYTGRLVAHALRADGFDASEDGTGRGTPIIVDTLTSNGDAHSGFRDEKGLVPMAFTVSEMANGFAWERDIAPTIDAHPQSDTANRQKGVRIGMQVRRLTPRECERLQGFPDDYTLIEYKRKPAKDGPRYKALGNSMAVPVMRWIGERIAAVDALQEAA
jgi:DNA (cytosine-5)-methyltransferase 1